MKCNCLDFIPPSDYNTSEQKQACKKHELYVSFRDLGWQVRQKARKRLFTCNKLVKISQVNDFFLPGLGLDHRPRRLRCVLLRRRMRFPTQRSHERHESRHRADSGAYFSLKPGPTAGAPLLNWSRLSSSGPLNVSWQRAKAVLRPHQAQRNIGALLRRQLQRDPQEIQKYGRQVMRLPLGVGDHLCSLVWGHFWITDPLQDVMYSIMYIKIYEPYLFPFIR